ncbi:MAG: hypothetical protein AAF577_00740 [Pseudomonadota bacterium]
MAKSLADLGVDHEYAPGQDPTLYERFVEWVATLELMPFLDSMFILFAIFALVLFFSTCMVIGRWLRQRAERQRAMEIAARKIAREQGVAAARRRLAAIG